MIERMAERIIGQPVGEHERLYAEMFCLTRPAAGGVVVEGLAVKKKVSDTNGIKLSHNCCINNELLVDADDTSSKQRRHRLPKILGFSSMNVSRQTYRRSNKSLIENGLSIIFMPFVSDTFSCLARLALCVGFSFPPHPSYGIMDQAISQVFRLEPGSLGDAR